MRNQLALGFALALGSIAIASAQPYPSRPITMVVPFAAGGPADTIGRIVAEGMRAGLTEASHMPLYVVYPVLLAFCAGFLALGLRNFRRRVLS